MRLALGPLQLVCIGEPACIARLVLLLFLRIMATLESLADSLTNVHDAIGALTKTVSNVVTKQQCMDDKFDSLDSRLCSLDSSSRHFSGREDAEPSGSYQHSTLRESLADRPKSPSSTVYDMHAEYLAIKDSLVKVKLPPELQMPDTGIPAKGEAKAKIAIIRKSSAYVSTGLKYLSTIDDQHVTVDNLGSLCTILAAHQQWLHSELTSAVGEGFGLSKDMSSLFRALKTNSSFFTPEEAVAFETAARITGAVALNSQTELLHRLLGSQRGGRGGGRFSRNRWRGDRKNIDKSKDYYEESVSSAAKDKP